MQDNLDRGCRTCGKRAQNDTTKDFLARGIHSATVCLVFRWQDQRLYTVQNMCVYKHISDCLQTVQELPLLPNNTAVKHLNTNPSGVKSSKDIYRWVTLDRTFYCLLLKQQAAAATVTATFCSYRIPGGGFITNIIITPCINYIIMFINNMR